MSFLFGVDSAFAEKSKKSGYRYIIDNYFSKRKSHLGEYADYSNTFALLVGTSLYRESKKREFKAFSSRIISYNQKVKEIGGWGDLNLQVAIGASQMERQGAFFIEITPRITVPEVRTAFPLYLGLGVGLGFYPRYILQDQAYQSLNSQFFVGLRLFDIYHNLGLLAELNLKVHSPLSELTVYVETLAFLGLILRF